ncbi:XdhC family protein [Streptomyces yokosukanensis]|uniref:XdhC family protein n=1 Tax=Streptomyces yokosukanensis TaxID=67386 RepID=UPI003F4CB1AE
MSRIGAFPGYQVTVCDARSAFTTPERFPHAHEVVVDWPHRYLAATETDHRTVVCVMTHDPKFDVPVLAEAHRRPFAHVGRSGRSLSVLDGPIHAARGVGLPAAADERCAVGAEPVRRRSSRVPPAH